MYSESEIDAAIRAGTLTPDDARKFRTALAAQKGAPAVDEEYVRLLTGFNDIFVSIALVLVLTAVGALTLPTGVPGLWVAAASWGLAEYFTARRRMALPSVLLLLTYCAGIASSLAWFIGIHAGLWGAFALALGAAQPVVMGALLIGPAVMGAAAWAHWRRFHVPITVAAGAGGVVLFGLSLVISLFPGLRADWPLLLLLAGLGVLGLGLKWDMSDPARQTRRADVAFWLHLLAAPLIVHPLFHMLGLLDQTAPGLARAGGAIGVYLALAVLALAVDRRALLVSGLAYLLSALGAVLKVSGLADQDLSITGLIAGGSLLVLSVAWHRARALVVAPLPRAIKALLPPL
jgi:hypothetical protein